MTRKALGKGLGALIPDAAQTSRPRPDAADTSGDGTRVVPLAKISPNPYQPRSVFDDDALRELAESIQHNGLIQPLVVRQQTDGTYELIAGERRFLASKKAGLRDVPVVIRKASRREMLEVAMVENLQREDLNPIEEAEAYHRLASEFGITQEEIAKRVGKSRTAVTNSTRLLSLPQEIQGLVSRGALSSGHARALLSLPDDASRMKFAHEIVRKGLSVRQAEFRVQQARRTKRPQTRKRSHPALESFEDKMRTRFGTQVRIVGGLGRGRVELHYFSEDDLERILELTGVGS